MCRLVVPAKDAHIIDIACGRGRHALELYRHGFSVCGIDLSAENIKYAKEQAKNMQASDNLQFMVHDMRKPYKHNFLIYLIYLQALAILKIRKITFEH